MAERADYTPRSRNQRPFWQSCVVMLGRIGSSAAVPALLDVLADPNSDLDQLIAAVRALSRIGDTRAVPALERLLERDDAPRERRFQATKASSRWPEREDGLWQLELAVAEVLARFGRPRPEIVQRYLDDPRNQPRRYARIVATASGMPVDGPIAVEVRPGVARVVEDRAVQQGHVDQNDFVLRREDYSASTMEPAGRIQPRT
jgi:HEAT repeat protein